MEILSFIAALVTALITALVTVRYNHKLDEKVVKKAFISELLINREVIKALYDEIRATKTTRSYPILHTVAYDDVRRKGLLYRLPKDLQKRIITLYGGIIIYNTVSTASTYGLVELIPDKVVANLSTMLDLIKSILPKLAQTWNIKIEKKN